MDWEEERPGPGRESLGVGLPLPEAESNRLVGNAEFTLEAS